MSSFRFNFSGIDDGGAFQGNDSKKILEVKTDKIEWVDSEEVIPEWQIKGLDSVAVRAQIFLCGDVEIGHVIAKEVLSGDNNLKNAVEQAEKEKSDLIPGKYEGGLKIWECTYDMMEYLVNTEHMQFDQLKVLDLGCGVGILGIYAYTNGAHVTFQDYNKEVLENITIPNVLLNIKEEEERIDLIKEKCKFYSGDWASFNKNLPATQMFDIIMTSETIYNPENYSKLIELFVQRLRKDGSVYIAAKTFYFGVGGGTRQFEECISQSSLLKSEVVWKCSSGIQREIIKVTRKQ